METLDLLNWLGRTSADKNFHLMASDLCIQLGIDPYGRELPSRLGSEKERCNRDYIVNWLAREIEHQGLELSGSGGREIFLKLRDYLVQEMQS